MSKQIKLDKSEFEHAIKSFGYPNYDKNTGSVRGKSDLLSTLEKQQEEIATKGSTSKLKKEEIDE